MQSGYLDVDGGRLAYDERGDGGEALVLIHAGIADRRMWDGVWELLDRGRRVVRYDMRSFGESSIPKTPFSHRSDLAALLDHLGIEQAAILGVSFGGNMDVD